MEAAGGQLGGRGADQAEQLGDRGIVVTTGIEPRS